MALSNWDTFAIDHEGKGSSGRFVSKLGVEVEIYKSWIYISDRDAWVEGGGYVNPIVMQVKDGKIKYKDVEIVAERWSDPESIFCAAWCGYEHANTVKGIVGIGTYGFEDNGEWGGVRSFEISRLKTLLTKWSLPKILRDVNLDTGVRFNQGDAFFAKRFGQETPKTSPGKAEEPTFMKIIKKWDDDSGEVPEEDIEQKLDELVEEEGNDGTDEVGGEAQTV